MLNIILQVHGSGGIRGNWGYASLTTRGEGQETVQAVAGHDK